MIHANRFRFSTSSVPKSNSPAWGDEFEIPLSGWQSSPKINIVIWSKERFRKEHLGEVHVDLKTLFQDGKFENVSWYGVEDADESAVGSLDLKFSLSSNSGENLREAWEAFLDHQVNYADEEGVHDFDDSEGEGELTSRLENVTLAESVPAGQVLGLFYLEIVKATGLPPLANMTRTGFDMDPFVVVSFGKKTFRTPHVKHNLNPVWNEKLMFPVMEHEKNFSINLDVLDKDKFTLNDDVAAIDFEISNVLKHSPVPDPATKLYNLEAIGYKTPFVKSINPATIPLAKSVLEKEGHSKSMTDIKGVMSLNDDMMMPFELPLKLSDPKYENKSKPVLFIKARFVPYGALRQQFWRGLMKIFDNDESGTMNFYEISELLESIGATLSEQTVVSYFTRFGKHYEDDELTIDEMVICLEDQVLKDTVRPEQDTEESTLQDASTDYIAGLDDNMSERLIVISACPFCKQPRMDKRSELDVVSHLATCASQDWGDGGLALGKFVTSNEARQRWYTKAVYKVTNGAYQLGANSANILVQDRITGYIQEEKMAIYVRLGIRILYKGLRSEKNMESKRAKEILKSQSIKQGIKYDDPASANSIPAFIAFHRLNTDEMLEPLENFKTFNEFFYRKLKPGARPLEAPDDERIVVSAADARSTFFPTISKATEIWIKGRDFSIKRLFGDAYPQLVDTFTNGALTIFRLAPQDYHRFHVPVSGVVGKPILISGEYYTVNPMAIRSSLDVYGENVRTLVPIYTEQFGTVMMVCVGAMMVGSTVITAKEGDHVKRGDELGYFKFGGSTIVTLFEAGMVKFDADLVENSSQALETLVRVGMAIGHAPSAPEYQRHDVVEKEDVEQAKVAIAGNAAETL